MTRIPVIPPEMPRKGNGFTRGLGHLLLSLLGWRVSGEIPPLKQCILAAAPHTSNWDFVVAMPAVLALGIRFSFMIKKEAFFWPCAGILRYLGGIPTDRSAPGGVVKQAASWYQHHEQLWVAIAPEGTRSKVERWKTGFLHIANMANLPVVIVGWDYPKKTIRFGKVFHPTGNVEQDIDDIRQYFRKTYKGYNPEFE